MGSGFDPSNLGAIIKAAFLNTPAAYAEVPGVTKQVIGAVQFAVKLAYTQAFKVVYYTALGFAILAIISAFCIREVDPAKMTLDKAVFLENEKPKSHDGKKTGPEWDNEIHASKV